MATGDETGTGQGFVNSEQSTAGRRCVLSINGGSSSVKFAVYTMDEPPRRLVHGSVERIGLSNAIFHAVDDVRNSRAEGGGRGQGTGDREQQRTGGVSLQLDERRELGAADHRRVVVELIDWIETKLDLTNIVVVGHRIVHSEPRNSEPALVT